MSDDLSHSRHVEIMAKLGVIDGRGERIETKVDSVSQNSGEVVSQLRLLNYSLITIILALIVAIGIAFWMAMSALTKTSPTVRGYGVEAQIQAPK